MMDDVTRRVVDVWLDSAVSSALKDLHKFEKIVESAEAFCSTLYNNGYAGFGRLEDWVSDAPMMWLAKCRETALDSVRLKLSDGMFSMLVRSWPVLTVCRYRIIEGRGEGGEGDGITG